LRKHPSERTADYYKKRPCALFVEAAAGNIDETFALEKDEV